MNTKLCILNLTDPNERLTHDLGANAATLAMTIDSPDKTPPPDKTPTGGSLVLYILGHGRQNRLYGPGGAILDERYVAETIQRLRGKEAPTLIVWDVCFAESMESIPATNGWPRNFVHIFSCRSFERTWHGPLPPNGEGVTLFSVELRKAVSQLRPTFDWAKLQSKLQSQFLSVRSASNETWSLQKPSIAPLNTKHGPSTFDLGELLGEPSSPTTAPERSRDANSKVGVGIPSAVKNADRAPVATHKVRHGCTHLRGIEQADANPQKEARFGKIFDLPPLGNNAPSPKDLGAPGGPMNGGTERNSSKKLVALMTYFGQFLNHDISYDPTSLIEQEQDDRAARNFRTPALELDSLYGAGPTVSSLFYDQTRPDKLLLGRAIDIPADVDVPRNSQGTAVIGDPRNDDNLIISQLHVAFIKFHNAIVDQLTSINDGFDDQGFEKAQRLVRWHYQWLVLNEFLPAIVSEEALAPVLKGVRELYTTKTYAFIPVEFSAAAYRFGHSMVQPRYVINDGFRSVVFSSTPNAWSSTPNAWTTKPGVPRTDLRGGPIRYGERINWKNFYDTGASESPGPDTTRYAGKIGARLASALLNLPPSFARDNVAPGPLSLAEMNLERGRKLKLPSGQDVANEVVKRLKNVPNLRALREPEIWAHPDLQKFRGCPAPLWYYFLREADVLAGGEQLGPIGGRIVAEVIVGLLDLDPSSFRTKMPTWKPPLADPKTSKFTFTDFFRVAGVDFQ